MCGHIANDREFFSCLQHPCKVRFRTRVVLKGLRWFGLQGGSQKFSLRCIAPMRVPCCFCLLDFWAQEKEIKLSQVLMQFCPPNTNPADLDAVGLIGRVELLSRRHFYDRHWFPFQRIYPGEARRKVHLPRLP